MEKGASGLCVLEQAPSDIKIEKAPVVFMCYDNHHQKKYSRFLKEIHTKKRIQTRFENKDYTKVPALCIKGLAPSDKRQNI